MGCTRPEKAGGMQEGFCRRPWMAVGWRVPPWRRCSRAEAEASLRLSLGRDTTAAEVEQAIAVIHDAVAAAQL